jgi:phenylpyruvate tautomerase PptA (4-oxalocrotonate tautomerase family)
VHVMFENVARENWVIGGAPELAEASTPPKK